MSKTPSQSLFEAPKLTVERLPVLQAVFEAVASGCGEGIRELCSVPASFAVETVEAASAREVLATYEDCLAALVGVPELDARLLVGFDRRCVFALIDAMYGGDGSEPPLQKDRPFTTLEQRIGRELCDLAIALLQKAFAVVVPLTLVREGLETRLELTTLGPKDVACVVAHFSFQVMEATGRMFWLMPQSALFSIRSKLEQQAQSGQHTDATWVDRFTAQLVKSDVAVEASIQGPVMTLADVTSLTAGQLIELPPQEKDFIELTCAGESLFTAELGKVQGRFAVVIERVRTAPSRPPDGTS